MNVVSVSAPPAPGTAANPRGTPCGWSSGTATDRSSSDAAVARRLWAGAPAQGAARFRRGRPVAGALLRAGEPAPAPALLGRQRRLPERRGDARRSVEAGDRPARRDAGAPMLFDLDEDIAEQHDLAAAHPDRVERLLASSRRGGRTSGRSADGNALGSRRADSPSAPLPLEAPVRPVTPTGASGTGRRPAAAPPTRGGRARPRPEPFPEGGRGDRRGLLVDDPDRTPVRTSFGSAPGGGPSPRDGPVQRTAGELAAGDGPGPGVRRRTGRWRSPACWKDATPTARRSPWCATTSTRTRRAPSTQCSSRPGRGKWFVASSSAIRRNTAVG